MPDTRGNGALSETAAGARALRDDTLTWVRKHWLWIAGALLLSLVWWLASDQQHEENGRYILVKDDVPCQSMRPGDEGRRWCYLVLDTRTGKLEERVRKLSSRDRRS